jgi:nucleoside-diphosphate-sugar epimerase
MIKILIIGKKSFLGSNLNNYLSKFYELDHFSYEKMITKSSLFFNNYSHIINTAIHPRYVKYKYDNNFDLDKKFIKKFKKINFRYIYLNTRKIYSPKANINENSKLNPIDNYAKNKLITEKFLEIKLKKKLINLRISNIIGNRIFKNSRNTHKLFFDKFLNYKKKIKKKKIIVHNDFKDFLSIDQFCRIISKIIELNIYGTYNVSIAEKIYLSQIINWIDKKFLKKITLLEPTKNSFTLSNTKLIKKIRIKITKNQLKLFCKKLI